MRRRDVFATSITIVTFTYLLSSSVIAEVQWAERQQDVQTACERREGVPANVHVDALLRPAIAEVWQRSATFRRQCEVIADREGLFVSVRLSTPFHVSSIRAQAEIRRAGSRWMRAIIDIPVTREFPELLAHEFEHVLEQVDGLKLAELARRRASGVLERPDGSFETSRAIEAGRAVALEFDEFRPAPQLAANRQEVRRGAPVPRAVYQRR